MSIESRQPTLESKREAKDSLSLLGGVHAPEPIDEALVVVQTAGMPNAMQCGPHSAILITLGASPIDILPHTLECTRVAGTTDRTRGVKLIKLEAVQPTILIRERNRDPPASSWALGVDASFNDRELLRRSGVAVECRTHIGFAAVEKGGTSLGRQDLPETT